MRSPGHPLTFREATWPRGRIPGAFPEGRPLATAQMESRAAPGGRKCTHTPRQKIKCSLAGWTWGLVLCCPLSHMPGVISQELPCGCARQLAPRDRPFGHRAWRAVATSSRGCWLALATWPGVCTWAPSARAKGAAGLGGVRGMAPGLKGGSSGSWVDSTGRGDMDRDVDRDVAGAGRQWA